MGLQIRGKLLLGFLTISIIFLIAGTLSILSINKLKRESQTVTSMDVPTLDAVTQIYLGITGANNQLFMGDENEARLNLERAIWYSNAILDGDKNNHFDYIPTTIPEVRSNIVNCKRDIEKLLTLSSKLSRRVGEDFETYKSIYNRVHFTVKDTKSILKSHMDSRIDYMDVSSTSSSIILVIAITISFFVSLITGWVLSNTISTPLREITFRLEDISNGDFDQKSLKPKTTDEVGILTEIYNNMLSKLSEFLKQADNIAIGDFTKDISPKNDKDNLGKAFKRMTERLRLVSEVANQVADGNTDISIEELSSRDVLAKSINKMTTSIKSAISQLRIKENNIDNLPTPVIAVDRDMNITFINKAGAKLKRTIPQDLIGSKCYDIFNSSHCNTNKCCVCKTIISGKPEQGEMMINTDFVNMPVTYSASPIRDENGKIIGALEYITDITEIKNLVKENQEKIEELTIENERKVWYQKGLTGISNCLREAESISDIANKICEYLASYLNVQVLTFYNSEDELFKLSGSYAYSTRKNMNSSFKLGEGLVGQAAKEKKTITITDVPDNYLSIKSSLGEIKPKNLSLVPLTYKNSVKGVIEVGSLKDFVQEEINFLNDISEPVAIALTQIEDKVKLREMLERSQDLAEELRASNEELEEQALTLQETQAKLEINQTEIEAVNEDLKKKSIALESQKLISDESNEKLYEKTIELEKSNKYKSEFLANMSHELRTPLNSILILSNKLIQNREKTLTDKQVTNASIINECGNDLLNMINDILDIAKIESGNMTLDLQEIPINGIAETITKNFTQFAQDKNLKFSVDIKDSAPKTIISDANKIKQVLKNLLSNALKFTNKGEITLSIYTPENEQSERVALSVKDTGIGIAKDKQDIIFEAFKQENGSITREYGGTGLGLSISNKLCELLGGELKMESIQGEGSKFTAYINTRASQAEEEVLPVAKNKIVIIDDHEQVAKAMQNICEDRNYITEVSNSVKDGINLVKEIVPEGVILNIKLSGGKGIEVMDRLKEIPETKDIPIHLINIDTDTIPENIIDEILLFLESSDKNDIDLSGKTALLVDDDVRNLYSVEEYLRELNMNVLKATDGKMAIEVLENNPDIDIVFMDIMMPVMDGYQSIKTIRAIPKVSSIPIIALTAKVLPEDKEKCISVGANDYLSKPIDMEKLIMKTGLWVNQEQ